jgi:hypothetical protein
LLGGPEENYEKVRIADAQAEIRTEHLLNISSEHYHYSDLLGETAVISLNVVMGMQYVILG